MCKYHGEQRDGSSNSHARRLPATNPPWGRTTNVPEQAASLRLMAALLWMLQHDRRRVGWSVEQTARQLGVSVRTYRKVEAGERSPAWETWDRIRKLFGWPQTFIGS
jgi:DNA-binding XRE family transcriptional regulator